jgi:hypothetical protein
MVPASSFRMMRSHVAASALGFAASILSNATPPLCNRWLWHVTQYLSSVVRVVAAAAATGAGCAGAAACCGAVCTLEIIAASQPATSREESSGRQPDGRR